MRALVLTDGQVAIRDTEPPERGPGEARIAVRLAGVCDTDLQLARGYLDYEGVLGHEFVGEVIDADDRAWVGQRVVADINAGCGLCDECCLHGGHHCARRTVLGIARRGGAIAEQLVVPERCLVRVPDAIDDDRAVFAEPLAAALHVLDVDSVRPGAPAIVVGDGKLGLLVAMVLKTGGVDVTLVGHHRHKLTLADGVTGVLESELAADLAVPIVVEATGNAAGLARALTLVSPRGTLVLKSTIAGAHDVDLSAIVINELTVVGSRCGDIGAAVQCLSADHVDPRPLIAARYGLADAERALAHAARPGILKVLVRGLT